MLKILKSIWESLTGSGSSTEPTSAPKPTPPAAPPVSKPPAAPPTATTAATDPPISTPPISTPPVSTPPVSTPPVTATPIPQFHKGQVEPPDPVLAEPAITPVLTKLTATAQAIRSIGMTQSTRLRIQSFTQPSQTGARLNAIVAKRKRA